MVVRPATRRGAVAAALAVLLVPAAAGAQSSDPGGTAAPEEPTVTGVDCGEDCAPGASVEVAGENLEDATKVVFRGGPGKADDRAAAPASATDGTVSVAVPAGARSGPVTVVAPGGSVTSDDAVKVRPGTAAAAGGDFRFPVDGRARIGATAVQRFGGARGHEGQDVFARCGTPVVANLAGTVKLSEFQGAAGNYVVVDGADGRSYAFMHLQEPSALRPGDPVYTGERIGLVGDTGRASGCHLHFEIWTAPGYYEGGEPVDPITELRAWDRAAKRKARAARKLRARSILARADR